MWGLIVMYLESMTTTTMVPRTNQNTKLDLLDLGLTAWKTWLACMRFSMYWPSTLFSDFSRIFSSLTLSTRWVRSSRVFWSSRTWRSEVRCHNIASLCSCLTWEISLAFSSCSSGEKSGSRHILFMWSEMWETPSDWLTDNMHGMESKDSKSTFFLHSSSLAQLHEEMCKYIKLLYYPSSLLRNTGFMNHISGIVIS